jgi:hypothetical protein
MYKFLIFITICLGSSVLANAQSPESHQKKKHVDSLNNFYIQQSLPLYLNVSTTPDGSDSHTLKNEKQGAENQPMTFDKNGVYDIKVQLQGKTTAGIFKVHADGIAPKTTVTIENAPKFATKDTTYYGVGLQSTLASKDAMSGVEGIFQAINSQTYSPYVSRIDLNQEGNYDYNFYATDKVGNVEIVQNRKFVVDLTAPNSAYTISGTRLGDILAPDVTFSLQATDNSAGAESTSYFFNEDKSLFYKQLPIPIAKMEDGDHVISYHSIDQVKNEETIKTYSFYLDKIAPMTSFEIIGDKFQGDKLYVSPRTTIELTAADNKAGVEDIFYTLNKDTTVTYSSPFLLPKKTGDVAIRYYAMDKVKNTGKATLKTLAVYYDETVPDLSSAFEGATFKARDTTFVSALTKLNITAKDSESGVQDVSYTLDGDQQPYNEPFTIDTEGFHVLGFASSDNVNNATSKEIQFFVDATPPSIRIDKSSPSTGTKDIDGKSYPVYPSYVILYLSALDFKVGSQEIYYTINGSEYKKYVAPLKDFKAEELLTITIRAIDNLGNPSEEPFTVYIDKQ